MLKTKLLFLSSETTKPGAEIRIEMKLACSVISFEQVPTDMRL